MFSTLQRSLKTFKTVQQLQLQQCIRMSTGVSEQPFNEEPTKNTDTPVIKPSGASKAMKAYLERAKEHEEFMAKANHEFQIAKRHLANMMGENPDTFTQEDIDNAIKYLFPSGLFEPKARPIMKPPEQVYPNRKAAEFDDTGRPYHFLFYTGNSSFYNLLYDIVENINELNKYEDAMIRKNIKPDPNMKLELSGLQWIDRENLQNLLVETVNEKNYDGLIAALERLVSLPYSYRIKDFILKYMKPLSNQTKNYEIPQPKVDSEGRSYITTYECLRKRARGHVTLRTGIGKISINGLDLNYFEDIQSREQM